MSLNYFDRATVADGTSAVSTINLNSLVTAIQTKGTDTYFDLLYPPRWSSAEEVGS
jgi:hypothetical protein